MGILKNISNFSLFANVFIFFVCIISQQKLGYIYLNINIGLIHLNMYIKLTDIIITTAAALGIVAITGFGILSTGANSEMTKAFLKIASSIILYIIVSAFTLTYFAPLGNFGTILYAVLTIAFAFGFIENFSGGKSSYDD